VMKGARGEWVRGAISPNIVCILATGAETAAASLAMLKSLTSPS
jgi:hypothetical protein